MLKISRFCFTKKQLFQKLNTFTNVLDNQIQYHVEIIVINLLGYVIGSQLIQKSFQGMLGYVVSILSEGVY